MIKESKERTGAPDHVDVSVIIPAYNEERFIGVCLRSLLSSEGNVSCEILVVDGDSTDGTRQVVRDISKDAGVDIKLLDNPRRRTPFAFNIGLEHARGDFIVILGAHAAVPTGWLQKSFDAITGTDPDVMLAGGKINNIVDPQGESPFAESIGYVIGTFWGGGVSQYRYSNKRQFVDTVMFGIYRRDVFERIGKFNTRFLIGQDGELNQRIRDAGFRILFDPDIEASYVTRNSWKKLVRQMYSYGIARARIIRGRGAFRVVHLFPLVFATYLIAVPVGAWVTPLYLTPLGLWGIVTLAFSLGDPSNVVRNFLSYATIHTVFGAGMIIGFLSLDTGTAT